jgi:thioredoxin-dependent peroxiredoxin
MKRILSLALLAGALTAAPAAGQAAPAAPAPEQHFLPVGTVAPDITLTGATRYGIIQAPLKLSDLRGETVVLAFFFRARTRG